jgi:uracil-DNA glycosylase
MTLQLDSRQRAMLAEMGVRVYEHVGREPAAASAVAPVLATASGRPTQVVTVTAIGAAAAVTAAPRVETGRMDWDALAQAVASCRACPACTGNAEPLFGSGDIHADWLIVGEPPDENEQAEGAPFVAEAGVLLDNMLKALGLDRRTKVFLTNIMKCRLPGSRNPTPEELAQCELIFRRQVQLLKPKIIVVMGRFAVPAVLGTTEPIGKLRGRAHQYQGVPVMVTYHPAYLLRNLADKAKAWTDLCLARELMAAQPA